MAIRAEDRDDITFAVPDAGLVTLGVFDGAGKLVRTLHHLAPEKDFRVETNGYATKWDGKDDSGRRLPAGHYHVRGYRVGNIKVAGEDFLFNDWAIDEAAPKVSRILDFSLLENGDTALLVRDGSTKTLVGRYSSERGFLWTKELPASSAPLAGAPPVPAADPASSAPARPLIFDPILATNSRSAIVLSGRGWDVFSLENGEASPDRAFDGSAIPAALAAKDDAVFVASSSGLISYLLPKWSAENVQPPPPIFKAWDADAPRLI